MHAHTHTTRARVHTHICTNTYTQDGYSAIDIAACNGHKDVVELLLDLKADPELTDKQVEILLCLAASKVTIVRYIASGSTLVEVY